MSDTTVDHNVGTAVVLGIRFFEGTIDAAIDWIRDHGGYLVIPASPALLKLKFDDEYRRALASADLALADSALLTRAAGIVTRARVPKISGQRYLARLSERADLALDQSSLWVVSSETARERAARWLRDRGFAETSDPIRVFAGDGRHDLLLQLEERRSRHVILALGSGYDEPLALYLREYLLYRPSIHCVGSALDFVTGAERAIPHWAEQSNLGWLLRLASQPRMLLPRIGIAISVAAMVLRYRTEMPPRRRRWEDM